jgi:hypothetical protein
MMTQITTRVETKNDSTPISLWEFSPHSTWDNFFSGDQVQNWMGEEGDGQLTMTRHDHLLEGVPKKYMAKKKTDTKMQSKVACFNNPITMVKTTEEYLKGYTSPFNLLLAVTFQVLILYVRTVCTSTIVEQSGRKIRLF